MLDKITVSVLSLLNSICDNGAYKIVTIEELISYLPKSNKLDCDTVRESIKLLREKEFVKVKYEDDCEFCLCTLPKGRYFCENKTDDEVNNYLMHKKNFLFVFFGSFLGSLFGVVAVFVLYFIFR